MESSNSALVVAGAFNNLQTDFIQNDFGLIQLVCADTRKIWKYDFG
jgi:hypothetical protein